MPKYCINIVVYKGMMGRVTGKLTWNYMIKCRRKAKVQKKTQQIRNIVDKGSSKNIQTIHKEETQTTALSQQ